MELENLEIGCNFDHHPKYPILNPCTICGKKPSIATISFLLKGKLCTHILIFLCKEHWDDVHILKAISKALGDHAADIESGPTWQKIVRGKTQK